MKNFNLIIIVFITFSILSCIRDQSQKKKNSEEAINFEELTKEIKTEYYSFPAPEEMFSYIDSLNLKYNSSLLNPAENADIYLSSEYKALNLGIYIADLAYITLFKKYKESMDYLQVIYKLCDNLRISSAFEKNFLDRVNNNIKNFDSLKVLSDEAYSKIINYLSKNNKEHIFGMISIGGFVEFLYISLSVCEKYDSNNIIVKKIFDQKAVLNNIYKFAEQYQDDPAVEKSLKIVAPLYKFYANIPEIKYKTEVKKTSDGMIKFSGGNKINFTKNDFEELKNIILQIRNEITNPN